MQGLSNARHPLLARSIFLPGCATACRTPVKGRVASTPKLLVGWLAALVVSHTSWALKAPTPTPQIVHPPTPKLGKIPSWEDPPSRSRSPFPLGWHFSSSSAPVASLASLLVLFTSHCRRDTVIPASFPSSSLLSVSSTPFSPSPRRSCRHLLHFQCVTPAVADTATISTKPTGNRNTDFCYPRAFDSIRASWIRVHCHD